MRIHSRLVITTLVWLVIFTLPVKGENYFRFSELKLSDGLPSLLVNQTYQQSNGFIWFATDTGVSRFDGKKYQHYFYSPGQPNHITNNFVVQIMEDTEGNIWLATEDGLNRLNQSGTIDYYRHDPDKTNSLNSDWIHVLYQDSKDRIWVGTSKGLNLYDPQSNSFMTVSGQSEATPQPISVYNIIEYQSDKFVLGTLMGLAFFSPNDTSFSPETERSGDHPDWYNDIYSSVIKSKKGNLLLGTEKSGLVDFDPVDKTFTQYKRTGKDKGLASNAVTSLTELRDGKIIVGHYNSGITIVSSDRKGFTYLRRRQYDETSLSSNYIKGLMVDRSGLLWVSTQNGVSMYSYLQSGTFLVSRKPDGSGLSGEVVYKAVNIDEDYLLVSTDRGVNKLRLSDGEIFDIDVGWSDAENEEKPGIWDIAKDQNGDFWMVSVDGLHKYNPDTENVTNYSNKDGNQWGLPPNELYTVTVDKNNNKWITGYLDVGLFKFSEQQGVTTRYFDDVNHRYTQGGNFSLDKLITHEDLLWLATTDGIFMVNLETGKEHHYDIGLNKKAYIRATSIARSDDGALWFSTQGAGLVRITVSPDESVQLEHFAAPEGFIGNDIVSVSFYKGELWVTTKTGLFSFDPATSEYTGYPSLLNVPDISFIEGGNTVADSAIYLGTNKGLLIVKPDQLLTNRFNPHVQVTNVKAGNKELVTSLSPEKQNSATVVFEDNSVSFSFAAMDFTNPKLNTYQYLLEGFDEAWIDAGNRQSVTYNNLLAGTYTFRVRATNSDGYLSKHEGSFTLTIKQPWWYFALWALGSLLSLALVLFAINRRVHTKTLFNKANFDSLTGLANRYHFNKRLTQLVSNPSNRFTLIIIDLDGFKEVNDVYGHAAGDDLIIQAASRMNNIVREGDLLARLGGDEFAIIINQQTHSEALIAIADRLRSALENNYIVQDHLINSSASIGAACFPIDAQDADALLVYADTAMFSAKQSGKNAVQFFNESLSEELAKRTLLRQNLQRAIIDSEFELFYQPQVDRVTEKITGLEALIRWFQPDGTMVPPDMFIPEAERNGSIVEIGKWVINEACRQAAAWHKEGVAFGKVSVNVSPAQITKSDLVSDVRSALANSHLPARYLELEITESVLVDNIDLTLNILSELKSIGVNIALDDFGTGYSSLNYLTKFPIDTLKIDRSFINSVELDLATKMVLKNIYSLANDLSMRVVAEGIETKEQLDILGQFNGYTMQGFYYSPPVNAEETLKLLCAPSIGKGDSASS